METQLSSGGMIRKFHQEFRDETLNFILLHVAPFYLYNEEFLIYFFLFNKSLEAKVQTWDNSQMCNTSFFQDPGNVHIRWGQPNP